MAIQEFIVYNNPAEAAIWHAIQHSDAGVWLFIMLVASIVGGTVGWITFTVAYRKTPLNYTNSKLVSMTVTVVVFTIVVWHMVKQIGW